MICAARAEVRCYPATARDSMQPTSDNSADAYRCLQMPLYLKERDLSVLAADAMLDIPRTVKPRRRYRGVLRPLGASPYVCSPTARVRCDHFPFMLPSVDAVGACGDFSLIKVLQMWNVIRQEDYHEVCRNVAHGQISGEAYYLGKLQRNS